MLVALVALARLVGSHRGEFVVCDRGRHYVSPRQIGRAGWVDCQACAAEVAAAETAAARLVVRLPECGHASCAGKPGCVRLAWVTVCCSSSWCEGLVFGEFLDPAQAACLAGIHNELHHGGHPLATVAEISEPGSAA